MSAPLNRSAYLVLGMIAGGFTTGYEISKHAEVASRFFWAAGDGHVYPQLKRLEADGLISCTAEAQGRRPRKVYALEPAGQQALIDWLTNTADLPMLELRHEGLLQLFFSERVSVGVLRERLGVLERMHDGVVAQLRLIESEARAHPAALLTQRFGIALNQAGADWCREMLTALSAEPSEAEASVALRVLLDLPAPGAED